MCQGCVWGLVAGDPRRTGRAAGSRDALTEGGDFPSKQRCTYLELVVALAFLVLCIEDVFYGCFAGDSGCTGRGACG
jgi:hypothetical protein